MVARLPTPPSRRRGPDHGAATTTGDRVLDTLDDLLDAGDTPTIAELANAVGTTEEVLLDRFGSGDALAEEALARVMARVVPYLEEVPPEGPLELRVEHFVEVRTRLCEQLGPLRRAGHVYAPHSDPVRRQVRAGRRHFSDQLQRTFAPELATLSAEERRGLLAALDTALSWDSWEHLRTFHRLGARRARRVVTRMVLAVLRDALHEAR